MLKRGVWHQCGDRSQKLVKEQLEKGNGVGVILSPRDLNFSNAQNYSSDYKDLGAHTMVDPQFHNPRFVNKNISSYPFNQQRASITSLKNVNEKELDALSQNLFQVNSEICSIAVIAPAIVYEAARNDIIDLNQKLFICAKKAGDSLGIPTIASVVLGKSVINSDSEMSKVLAATTCLAADGWYFGCEFTQHRIPSSEDEVSKCGYALLTLAATGKSIIHAYAGPMALLSFAFGATATCIGHSQNLWQFSKTRFEPSVSTGGNANAPSRFFSSSLWGTIIFPDELALLSQDLKAKIITETPFSAPLLANIKNLNIVDWPRWDSNKHLLYAIGKKVSEIANRKKIKDCAISAYKFLKSAISLHNEVANQSIPLKEESKCTYQSSWKKALNTLINNNLDTYNYIEMLSTL